MLPDDLPKRVEYFQRRKASLWQVRSDWDAQWQDIAKFQAPRHGRWNVNDVNRGRVKHNSIINGTALRAVGILEAGMMSGGSSPARPWFEATMRDRDLARRPRVARWLHQITELIAGSIRASNGYHALRHSYRELGLFGTAACLMLPNDVNPYAAVHYSPMTVGEYALQTDFRGRVVTLYREFPAAVGQLVREFGIGAVSDGVRSMWNNGEHDKLVPVTHAIEPRFDRDPDRLDVRNMPWASVYFEQSETTKFLRESGMLEFPALTPRWSVVSNDAYGSNCPGMDARGDAMGLQHLEKRKAQALDKKLDPPMAVPPSMKHGEVSTQPGGRTPVDQGPNGGIRPIIDPAAIQMRETIEETANYERRIRQFYHEDMFLMVSSMEDTGHTAFEIARRQEEKMTILGPVYEFMQTELYEPMIRQHFQRLDAAGLLPPPPEEVLGQELSIEFVSVLAQAQKAVATVAVDRFIATLGVIGNMRREALDKLDVDETIDRYGEALGVPPQIIVPTEKTLDIRAARAQAEAEQARMQGREQQAKIAKDLAAAKTGPSSNAMTDIMSLFSGYGSPSPQQAGALNI